MDSDTGTLSEIGMGELEKRKYSRGESSDAICGIFCLQGPNVPPQPRTSRHHALHRAPCPYGSALALPAYFVTTMHPMLIRVIVRLGSVPSSERTMCGCPWLVTVPDQ